MHTKEYAYKWMNSVVLNYVAQVHYQQQNHGANDRLFFFYSALHFIRVTVKEILYTDTQYS